MNYPRKKQSWDCDMTTESQRCAQELLAWGHVFNAAGILSNNQGQSEYVLWEKLRCPSGVTGCCGVFKHRQPYSGRSRGFDLRRRQFEPG